MEDAGDPISYLVLEPGTAVAASDGTIVGTVEHVLAADQQDIFDGLVVRTDAGPRFVDADQVQEIRTRLVRLTLRAAAVAELPPPRPAPPVIGVDPDETVRRLD